MGVPRVAARSSPPLLLLLLTAVSGATDATSFLGLGHVFVANMTGNVALLGLALAGAGGLSIAGSTFSLGLFMVGAIVAGSLLPSQRGRPHSFARAFTVAELVPIAVVAGLAVIGWAADSALETYLAIGLLAFAMGTQAAGAGRFSDPELERTNMLTATLSLIGITVLAGGVERARAEGKLALSVAALFLGALTGAVLLLRFGLPFPLLLMVALVATVSLIAHRAHLRDSSLGKSFLDAER
ncbi:MAG: YoaK family protein [Thermoplasmata archaeon]